MKNRFRNHIVIIVSIIMTTSTFAQTGEEVKEYDLKYKMNHGREFTFYSLGYGKRYLRKNDTTEFVSSRDRELVQDYKAIRSDENGLRFEVKYQTLSFNDLDANGENIKTRFSSLIGKKVYYTISPCGEMADFVGFDKLPEVSFHNGTMTGEIHRQEITHMFPVFPKRPVTVGETWSRNAFGFNIEYKLLGEIEFNGYDCVRIFAQMSMVDNIVNGKDNNGMEYIRETIMPYTDMYYFAYKEGMILYRFSVCSEFELLYKTIDNDIYRHLIGDQIWEEHIILK